MYARFNLKTNGDFSEVRNLKYSSKLELTNFLVEYTADLDEWYEEVIDMTKGYFGVYYYFKGKEMYESVKNQIHELLDSYIGVNGVVNGSKLQDDWFPSIKEDTFLSHSHKDKELAIKLAGWLYNNFNLITFIDSCIWDYSDKLIKEIDEKYCKNYNNTTYNYKKRNISTSHVHMMLMNALIKIIDKSECVFFLNTDNFVIKTEEEILKNKNKTYSPWIYSEINATNLVRKKPLIPLERNRESVFKSLNESTFYNFLANYSIDLSEIYEIDDSILYLWKKSNAYSDEGLQGTKALDKLYELTISKE